MAEHTKRADLERVSDRDLIRLGLEAVARHSELEQKAVEYEMWRREHATSRRAAFDTLIFAATALLLAVLVIALTVPNLGFRDRFTLTAMTAILGVMTSVTLGWWFGRLHRG